MLAFREEVLAESVEHHKLPRKRLGLLKALGHEHDFANQSQIWNAHAHWPEQRLHSFTFCKPGIPIPFPWIRTVKGARLLPLAEWH